MISVDAEPDAVRERAISGASGARGFSERRMLDRDPLKRPGHLTDHPEIVRCRPSWHPNALPALDNGAREVDPVLGGLDIHAGPADEVYRDTLRKFVGVATSRVELRLDSARRQFERYPDRDYASKIAALEDLLAERYARSGPTKRVRKRPRTCKPPARWMPIINRLCKKHRVSRKELFSGYKDARIVDCRHEVWWTIRDEFGSSFPMIGRRMGGYCHTSIMHGVRKWRARMNQAEA